MSISSKINKPQNFPVIVLSDNAKVKTGDKTYSWWGLDGEFYKLHFKEAYDIEPKHWGEGLYKCEYQVLGRKFTDLSFVKGNTLQELGTKDARTYEIRSFGNDKALYRYEDIPTFDSDDREYDGNGYCIIFRDTMGVHLFEARAGYKLPSISIYLSLQNAEPDFDKWLQYLNN